MSITVKELKKMLDNYPDEMIVVQSGHSDGGCYDYFGAYFQIKKLKKMTDISSWRGELDEDNNGEQFLQIN